MAKQSDPPWWALALWLAGMIALTAVIWIASQPGKPWGIGD